MRYIFLVFLLFFSFTGTALAQQAVSIVDGSEVQQNTLTAFALNFDVSSQTSDFYIAFGGNKIKIENPTATQDWTINMRANSSSWSGATYSMSLNATLELSSFDVKDSGSTSVLSLFETVVSDGTSFTTTDTTIISSNNSDVELDNDTFYIEGMFIQQTIPAAQASDIYTIGITIDFI